MNCQIKYLGKGIKNLNCVFLFRFFLHFEQGLRKLVGTGGGFIAAADTFETGHDIINLHAFYQGANTLQVTIASAVEFHI